MMPKNKNINKPKTAMHQTVHYSILEGSFSMGYELIVGVGGYFIVQLLTLLNAASFHFGLVIGIIPLAQSMQFIAARSLILFKNKKKPTIIYLLSSRLLIIFLIISALVLPKSYSLYFVLIILLLANLLFMASQNIWNVWIAESIPHHFRGRFFAERNRWVTLISLILGAGVSIYIDLFKPDSIFYDSFRNIITNVSSLNFLQYYVNSDNLFYALLIAFGFAILFGITGVYFLTKQPAVTKERLRTQVIKTKFFEAIKIPLRDKNFRKLLIFFGYWNFAIHTSSPYWGKYMLEILRLNFFEYWSYAALSSFVIFFAYKKWGSLVDKIGNKPVMAIAIVLSGINPLFYVFAQAEWFWIIYIEAFGSAIMWSAATIVTSNFVLSVTPKDEKAMYIAVLALFSGGIGFITATTSGFVCDFIPQFEFSWITFTNMQILFFIGALLRWSALIFLLPIMEDKTYPLKQLPKKVISKIRNVVVYNFNRVFHI